jgi:serine phosphatase RsbU (regulator of sigma subunit)
MGAPPSISRAVETATLIVTNPSGATSRIRVDPLPFTIGRSADNHLVLRDNRASRNHARITSEGDDYFVEDVRSSHGVHVNGSPVKRHRLTDGDRIEFGVPDSYTLVFTREPDIRTLLKQLPNRASSRTPADLGKLRALVEVARALQNSLSPDDVLASVVDAALAITGFERGFLLLNRDHHLETSVARGRDGASIDPKSLTVPMDAIQRALDNRSELLSMHFEPETNIDTASSTAELRRHNVICVPLVHVRTGSTEETCMVSTKTDTIGVIYLDTPHIPVDLTTGSSALLQTLALEASTVLENARLLDEERAKQRMEEELAIAREIQESLLPKTLPSSGWFRVAGSSIPSHAVGGDYFDVRLISASCWSVVVADVSGKGVSSALLAAFLQGAFLLAAEGKEQMERHMARVNRFLNERTEGEKYATVFFAMLHEDGMLRWANAGHCTPFLVKSSGDLLALRTTGLPLGMLDIAEYVIEETKLAPGDKIVIYSDGLSEAQNARGEFFDAKTMRAILREDAASSARQLHDALMAKVRQFTGAAEQQDDITAVVLEYQTT